MVRQIKKKLLLWPWFLISLCLFVWGCEQNQPTSNSRATPELMAISPDSGTFDSEIILSGAHFASNPDQNVVHFNNSEAEIISATTQQIIAKVPPRAKSGPVTVTVQNKTSNEL